MPCSYSEDGGLWLIWRLVAPVELIPDHPLDDVLSRIEFQLFRCRLLVIIARS